MGQHAIYYKFADIALQVFTYDVRQVCAFKPQGLSAEGVSRQLVSISSDTLAAVVGCSVRCYETAQGRPVGEALNHSLEVKAVCLSQVRSPGDLTCWRAYAEASPQNMTGL